MAAASGAQVLSGRSEVTEEQLLDVLYEILAQGVDPTNELSVAEVERFLHEHARQKKQLPELLAFFEKHNLSHDPAAYAPDPELGELAHGLQRERGPNSVVMLLDAVDSGEEAIFDSPTRREQLAQPAPVADETSGVKPRAEPVADERRTPLLRYAVVGLFALLIVGFGFSVLREQELERKLAEARLQQRTTDIALAELEKRAEALRAELERSEAQQGALAERFDAFVTDAAHKRAAEDEALKKLLGPRYETVRRQALERASAQP